MAPIPFPLTDLRVRPEDPQSAADIQAIRAVNEAAFGGTEEGDLADQLRRDRAVLVSLVAELDSAIVGHILFSRMWIDTAAGSVPAVALAPLAVHPQHQRRRIGHSLIEHGLDLLRTQAERIVIVLGHPGYYPRFGFSTHAARLLDSPFQRGSFMAMELVPGSLTDVAGPVRYPAAFGL